MQLLQEPLTVAGQHIKTLSRHSGMGFGQLLSSDSVPKVAKGKAPGAVLRANQV